MCTEDCRNERNVKQGLRHLIAAGVLAAGLGLAGCNTVEGAGEDIEDAGDAIDDAANDARD